MDADKSVIRINPAQEAFDRNKEAVAANRARRMAKDNALSKTKAGVKLDGVPAGVWSAVPR